MLMLALTGLGLYAVTIIPKESFPEVIVPVGIVTTVYPGASASDIEELITNKLEDAIANVEGIENLTSTSRDDVSTISVEFAASADIDKSIQKLIQTARIKGNSSVYKTVLHMLDAESIWWQRVKLVEHIERPSDIFDGSFG